MEQIENKIEKILSNPESVAQIMSIASAFLGGNSNQQTNGAAAGESSKTEEISAQPPRSVQNNFKTNGKGTEKLNLLMAVKPFLNEPHRNSIDRAVKIVKIAKTAQNTLNTFGGAVQNV